MTSERRSESWALPDLSSLCPSPISSSTRTAQHIQKLFFLHTNGIPQHHSINLTPYSRININTMFALLLTLLAAFLLISPIQAVCPGYNYAFWSFPSREMNRVRWAVSDSWCIFRSNCALGNPCDCPYQGCSPPPVHVDKVTILGLWCVSPAPRFT